MNNLNSEFESLVSNSVNAKIREFIEGNSSELIQNKICREVASMVRSVDFLSEVVKQFLKARSNSDWLETTLLELAQSVLDVELLPYIEKRVIANLDDGGIETFVADALGPSMQDLIGSEEVSNLIENLIFKSIQEKLQSPEFASKIDMLVQSAFQESINKITRNISTAKQEP